MKFFLLYLLNFFMLMTTQVTDSYTNSEPILLKRYENGCGYFCLGELAIDIANAKLKNPESNVAMRFCSKEAFPIVLSSAGTEPQNLFSTLNSVYKYDPTTLFFLRSGACESPVKGITAFEIWIVPQKENMPTYDEKLEFCQVEERDLNASAQIDEKTVAKVIKDELDRNPNAVVIIVGYYYKKISPQLTRNINKIQREMKKNGIQKKRYLLITTKWTSDNYGVEPTTPQIKLLEVKKQSCKQQKDNAVNR